MKKALSLVLTLASLLLLLVGCGADSSNPIETMTLTEIMEAVYEKASIAGINTETRPIMTVGEERLAYFFGTEFDCKEAIASEPEMGFGYSVCLARVDAGKAESIAAEILEKADTYKWICAHADSKVVAVNGNVVLLCMTSEANCAAFKEAFLSISAKNEEKPSSGLSAMTLTEVLEKVYEAAALENVNTEFYPIQTVEKDRMTYFFGTEFSFTEAIASEPEIGWGYSVCLARVDAKKAEKIAADVLENANEGKWVCVFAECKIVAVRDDIVMLCMTTNERCAALKAAFLAL